MDLGLSSKVVLLTGGTSGIGLEAAREFLQEGASVCLMGRSEERGREAAARLGNRLRIALCTHASDCTVGVSYFHPDGREIGRASCRERV